MRLPLTIKPWRCLNLPARFADRARIADDWRMVHVYLRSEHTYTESKTYTCTKSSSYTAPAPVTSVDLLMRPNEAGRPSSFSELDFKRSLAL